MLATLHGCKADMRRQLWFWVAAFTIYRCKTKLGPRFSFTSSSQVTVLPRCLALGIPQFCIARHRDFLPNIYIWSWFLRITGLLLKLADKVMLKNLQFWEESLRVSLELRYERWYKNVFFPFLTTNKLLLLLLLLLLSVIVMTDSLRVQMWASFCF